MIYVVTINNTEYEVEVEIGKASIVKTTAVTYAQPQAASPATTPLARAAAQTVPVAASSVTSPEGAVPVKSPMPGTILDVKVSVGTTVKRGDILLILEAMKMENEITAAHDGTVVQIAVQKGASVSTGDLLLSIK
jgi:biotin carboxyl carrier protein